MRSKLYWLLVLVLAMGMLLSACGGDEAAEEVEDEPVARTVFEPTEEPELEPEPTEPAEEDAAKETVAKDEEPAEQIEPVEEVVLASEEDLDAAFGGMLASMVKYNTTGLDTPIVSYCSSGWRCTVAMTELGALGWENVLSLKGGSFGGWFEAGYPVIEGAAAEPMVLKTAEPDPALLSLVDTAMGAIPEDWGGVTAEQLNTAIAENPDLIVIDVRTQGEVDEKGAVDAPNLIHIPLEEFNERRAEWLDNDATVVIYCGSGHRSTMAMAIMWTYGYENASSLEGGFGGWAEAGYSVAELEAVSS